MEVVSGAIVAAARGTGTGAEAEFGDERLSSSSFAILPVKEIYVIMLNAFELLVANMQLSTLRVQYRPPFTRNVSCFYNLVVQ